MGLSTQSCGNEQISALFENGVIVPMRESVAAQCRKALNQAPVTTVSELSNTTSAEELAMPRLAVAMKPRFRSLRRSATCGRRRFSSSAKSVATPGSGEPSSINVIRQSAWSCASTLSMHRRAWSGALNTGMMMSIEKLIVRSSHLPLICLSFATQALPQELDANPRQFDPPSRTLTVGDDSLLGGDRTLQTLAFTFEGGSGFARAARLFRFACERRVRLCQFDLRLILHLGKPRIAFGHEVLEMTDVPRLTIERSVAVMQQGIEPQHLACLLLDTPHFAIGAI